MDMVEKVAFAIAKARRDAEGQVRPSQLYEHLARAAIAAMRDMEIVFRENGGDVTEIRGAPADVWLVLIDAALTSSEKV